MREGPKKGGRGKERGRERCREVYGRTQSHGVVPQIKTAVWSPSCVMPKSQTDTQTPAPVPQFPRCHRRKVEGRKKSGSPFGTSHPPSDPRPPPPRSGFATNSDGRGTRPYRTAGRAAAATAAAGGGVNRSSLRRVFVGGGGGALSRDNRRSKARTRSATPGERGETPPPGSPAASSDVGDDAETGWVSSPVGLPAADLKGECIIGDSETEELSVRVEWYDGSPRTSNARNGCG